MGKTKKPRDMGEDAFDKIDRKAKSTIQLCLSDEVLREVVDKESTMTLWIKLESLYMSKSTTNRILLKVGWLGLC